MLAGVLGPLPPTRRGAAPGFVCLRSIATLPYTNAACDEIKERLEFEPLIEVSTIHSFSWSLIDGFNSDIRIWVQKNIVKEIAEPEEAQRKGRAGSKAALERERSIESKRRRLGYPLGPAVRSLWAVRGGQRREFMEQIQDGEQPRQDLYTRPYVIPIPVPSPLSPLASASYTKCQVPRRCGPKPAARRYRD